MHEVVALARSHRRPPWPHQRRSPFHFRIQPHLGPLLWSSAPEMSPPSDVDEKRFTTAVVNTGTEVAAEEKENAPLAATDVVVLSTTRTEWEVAVKLPASRMLRTGVIATRRFRKTICLSSFRGRTVHG